ncbi:MAG: hypothetical protein KA293_10680 [Bacteroidia bacterium]|nr:hypothetical protein [Bacteroidia bacterium]
MEKTKLVTLLRTFDVWELRNLRELVNSPFFNKQEIVVRLLEETEKYLKRGESTPELEVMHQRLWPELAYEHQRLRYVMTDLTRLVEEFLVQKQLASKHWLQGRLLLEGLAERKQEKYFGQGLAKALEKLDKDGLRDADYHYERFRLHQLAKDFETDRKEKTGEDWLHPLIEDLQNFFFGTRLRLVCDLVSKAGGNVQEGDKQLVDELRKRLGKQLGNEPVAIAIYETVLQMLTHTDPELYFRKLRMSLKTNAKHFQQDELMHLYGFALSFSIQQLNRGTEGYLQEIFWLYQEQLENKVLIQNETFPAQHFKNILTVGLRLKEFDWTREFIESYSKLLPESEKESIVAYSHAALHYVLGAFAECRKLLQFAMFSDPVYELEGKILLMKSLYELEDWNALHTLAEKQLKYLKGNSAISERQRNFHANFVQFLIRLVDYRQGSRAPLGALIGAIEATREASDLKWLRQKVDEAAKLNAR